VEVLDEGLLHLELLRPLHVVALVLHVDAGFGNLELIQGLHRLELDEPRATQPGDDDVLGELRVGACRNPDRGIEGLSVDLSRESVGGRRREEEGTGDAEDGVLGLQLIGDPANELFERQGVEAVGHANQHTRPTGTGFRAQGAGHRVVPEPWTLNPVP